MNLSGGFDFRDAWYWADRGQFVGEGVESVVSRLASAAVRTGWHIEGDQHDEWAASVEILQRRLAGQSGPGFELLRSALQSSDLSEYTDVVLEFNLRRRGLRLDCVLFAPGLILVLEFKRTRIGAADRDQVANYCVNLVEFHEETRRLCESRACVVLPALALTQGRLRDSSAHEEFYGRPWNSILKRALQCDAAGMHGLLVKALQLRRSKEPIDRDRWLSSKFSPSSTILDAAISLYGLHDVSAIDHHAVPAERIRACTEEVAQQIQAAQSQRRNRVIFVSGSPGSGKTLVGLNLAFDRRFRDEAVFVTGNAPLVDVLSEALKNSYRTASGRGSVVVESGYPQEAVSHVLRNSTFKIVKAHSFLGERGRATESSDGRILIFDEAQRTYEKGRSAAGSTLTDHEADLILKSLEDSYSEGAVVVALLGHNQAINTGERGAVAWFEAAHRRGWDYAVSDETLQLTEIAAEVGIGESDRRLRIHVGHLSHSMRFYRNKGIEEWAQAVLENSPRSAREIAATLRAEGHTAWLSRDLKEARRWVRAHRIGSDRAGMIGSAQGRRLAAEGLYVDQKSDIGPWMLAPSGDVRSSNMLETVQNQFQIQGLELDLTLVCWDADLRREDGRWAAYSVWGGGWRRNGALDVAKNGYRVLLTRARKGMVIFVPRGDLSREDETRKPEFYDGIANYLMDCGACEIESEPE